MKTIESSWPYATTLFDYVKRAMPLATHSSLRNDEIYAVSASILAQAKTVPEDAVMTNQSLPKVQTPNRDSFVPNRWPESFKAKAPTSAASR